MAGTISLKYYLLSAQFQHYVPIGRDYALGFNALFDYGGVYGSDKPYPVIKDVYAGGIGTVRGYLGNSLGPKDSKTGTFLGGSKRVVGNAQFSFPLPGTKSDPTLRLFVFADAGQVYGADGAGNDTNIDFGDLRYSTGLVSLGCLPWGHCNSSMLRLSTHKLAIGHRYFSFRLAQLSSHATVAQDAGMQVIFN